MTDLQFLSFYFELDENEDINTELNSDVVLECKGRGLLKIIVEKRINEDRLYSFTKMKEYLVKKIIEVFCTEKNKTKASVILNRFKLCLDFQEEKEFNFVLTIKVYEDEILEEEMKVNNDLNVYEVCVIEDKKIDDGKEIGNDGERGNGKEKSDSKKKQIEGKNGPTKANSNKSTGRRSNKNNNNNNNNKK